ncbi:Disease resistance protein RPS6 [Cardamine amara subsp. amara]|uniref:Disease resistance protein RPS6 n=1 Tax=Cardamine amara subsp. amara TaxID=228776 RepID=A0ABD1C6A8_CARAN
MLCRFAFKKNSPPDDLMELVSEVAFHVGNLPLGLKVLGSFLRGRDKEDWVDMMPRLRNGLDGKIEKTLRLTYDGLDNRKDKAIFRHIACLFNGERVSEIKLLLANSNLDVNIGLKNLVDRSLVHVRGDIIEMHRLLQEMGKEIVRTQSNEPGEREFLTDSKDICYVLDNNTGTKNVLGIALDINEIDELHIHESAFKEMHNLLFLEIYSKVWDRKKEGRWHLSEGFDYLSPKLRLLRLDGYPMRCMPSKFCPENLVKLQMQNSSLEKLWDGAHSLTGLKDMDLWGSENLTEIPDLSMATNLKTLSLSECSSLVELPSSIQYLNKLETLNMAFCTNLETLPIGINLQSLFRLDLNSCSRLRTFPQISTNISELLLLGTSIEEFPSTLRLEKLINLGMSLVKSGKLWERVQPLTPLMTLLSPSLKTLWLSDIPNLVELPSSFQNLNKLEDLSITNCVNLETFPTGINLESLEHLELRGCLRLRTFPNISTNISALDLTRTAIEEVPWWIENFTRLITLHMKECNNLHCVSLNISKLKRLMVVDCSDCKALTKASWNDSPLNMAPVPYQEALLHQQSVSFKSMEFSGEEVPSYFTHRSTETSLTNIPLLHTSPSKTFFRFRACVVVDTESFHTMDHSFVIQFRFKVAYPHLKLKGCGLRLLEDSPSLDNQSCNPNIVPHICESNKSIGDHLDQEALLHQQSTSNSDNLGVYETEHNTVERRTSRKRTHPPVLYTYKRKKKQSG